MFTSSSDKISKECYRNYVNAMDAALNSPPERYSDITRKSLSTSPGYIKPYSQSTETTFKKLEAPGLPYIPHSQPLCHTGNIGPISFAIILEKKTSIFVNQMQILPHRF